MRATVENRSYVGTSYWEMLADLPGGKWVRNKLSPASYRPPEEYGSVWPSVELRDGCVATGKL